MTLCESRHDFKSLLINYFDRYPQESPALDFAMRDIIHAAVWDNMLERRTQELVDDLKNNPESPIRKCYDEKGMLQSKNIKTFLCN